jgi:chemosensory pili system protein ChpA (sensor histidine kinase/response regulator)
MGELENLRGNLEILFDYQRRLIEEMQDKLLRLRMVSFGSLSNRLNRTVRVTAEQENKQVELVIEGEKLELDTQILDSLIEPLLHLLRNAVAHGIETPDARRLIGKPETGKITLRIYSEGMHIVLSVTDDGRGITASALKAKAVRQGIITAEAAETMSESKAFELIFLPGVTTAQEINYVSGRGVGMNIVKTSVERQQGAISINSETQKGTTFTIRLPMSLAITRALLVKSNNQTFAFPLKIVKKVLEIPVKMLEAGRNLRIENADYALSNLNDLLGVKWSPKSENAPLLLIETLEKPRAVAVEEILKTEEIVIKPLGNLLNNPATVGAAILGDGSVVQVLDLIYLLDQKVQSPKSKVQSSLTENESKIQNPKSKILNVLIVDDSPSVRHINSKLIKGAGMSAAVAKDGLEALEILQSSENLPDVILTDVEMPRMDGYELLASLKKTESLRRLPVVMITSRAGDKHRQKAFELGVSDYLTKPYEDTKLIEIIHKLTSLKF